MSALGAIGLGLQLVGGIGSTISQNTMAAQQAAYSKEAENARSQQMQLEAQRQKRQAVRQSLMARSMALTAGASQGAQYGSGVAGGMGEAVNTGAEYQQGTNSSTIIGGRIFDANRNYFDATANGEAAMSMWSGISSLGGVIAGNSDTIGRLGQDWGARSGTQGTANVAPVPQRSNFGQNWARPYYNMMNQRNSRFNWGY